MKAYRIASTTLLGLICAYPALARDVANTNVKLSCNVAGFYADGSRVKGSGSEDISIDIKRVNRNEKDLSKPPLWDGDASIKVTSNGSEHAGALLKSTADQVAFVVANDAQVDGISQSLSMTYEIRLDRLRLKRTVFAMFSSEGNTMQSAEGNCVRIQTPVAATPAPTAASAASAAAPDWLIDFRRKLKECAGKDPLSAATCTERIRARYCSNRDSKFTECLSK